MESSEFLSYFEKVPAILKYFMGVYSIDNIPRSMKILNFFVCNLSKQSERGTHWIGFIKSRKNEIEIFDSLGNNFNLINDNLNFRQNVKILYNETPFQGPQSISCGKFVIMYLIERLSNIQMSYKHLLTDIFKSDFESNEIIVNEFCSDL